MDLRLEMRYDAPPDAVIAMLADEDFLARVAEATGALSHEAAASWDGDAVSTRLHRVMPPVVPDFVRSFIGDSLDVVETVDWREPAVDGSREGTATVEIAKAPVSMKGTTTLEPSGDATVQRLHCKIKAGVPLVGGKIERACAQAVELGLRKQEQVAAAWLAG